MNNTNKRFLGLDALTALVGFSVSAETTESIAISGSISAIIDISVTSESFLKACRLLNPFPVSLTG